MDGGRPRWSKDWTGNTTRIDTPYANVWQQIEGLPSLAMAYVWAAIHLVAPLEEAGYVIEFVNAIRNEDMVLIG